VSEENIQPTPEPGEDQAPADAMDEALAELLDEAAAAGDQPPAAEPKSETEQLTALVAERTNDLQRLHAEYANYKKRVDRDRALSRAAGIEAVILDLLPILDSIEAAREHSELVGGFKLVAEEFEKTASKYGLETFGEVGDAFDPQIHEALMALPMDGELAGPTVSAVMQRGVRLNERVIRPARVGVADPDA
jgi:Molecular chaperone GrpE (heat shock protein)